MAGIGPAGTLLDVADLSVAFDVRGRAVQAVRGVDLTIGRGEIVALVGESGSGKSTIGLTLMHLFGPEDRVRVSGRAMLHDKQGRMRDLAALSARQMRDVRGEDLAMIFQEPLSSLDPVFTIGAQIVEAVRSHRKVGRSLATDRALELLAALGLADPEKLLTTYPHQISGGMRQRVMIAMALACEPLLLIADEPTTALDVTVQAQIVDLLKRIQAQTGMAILFITHDLGLVAEIADRAYVMYAGQIVETGHVADLFTKPHMPYTKALLQTRPMLGSSLIPGYRLDPIPGQAPSPAGLPPGCAFAGRCAHAAELCRSTLPTLETLDQRRAVRCLRWRELLAVEPV